MKILLTGCNGQVGFELQRSLAPLGEVVAVDHADCDLADAEAIRKLVRDTRPDVIVNPAAYTAVDKAESDRERAAAVNAVAPGVFGEEAAKLGALNESELAIAILLDFPQVDELLEAPAHQLEEFGHAREVPVRVGDLGVAHVGR